MTGQRSRRDELAGNLALVHERIAAAARAAGRDPDEVTLVAVTKTHPASDVDLLASLGVRHVAENRDQEARPKVADVRADGLVWHFVGQLQTNKVRSVASYADVVESVDRPRLVQALAHQVQESGRALDVLVQVSLDPPGAEGRGGVPLDPGHGTLLELCRLVADAPGLRLAGLMAVAPPGDDPEAAFARLAEAAAAVRAQHPEARTLSAGMSGDLEQAVAYGSTHVRVGTALLGARPVPFV